MDIEYLIADKVNIILITIRRIECYYYLNLIGNSSPGFIKTYRTTKDMM